MRINILKHFSLISLAVLLKSPNFSQALAPVKKGVEDIVRAMLMEQKVIVPEFNFIRFKK